jgi:4-amino-4-deoxy-L-arabinose transferase-like glycosyltransferase
LPSSPTAERAKRSAAWLLPGLLFAYVLVPGHPLALLRGVPLDVLGLALGGGLAIVLYGFGLPRPSRLAGRWALVVILLIGAKLVLWWVAPSYGLAASYYSRPRIGGVAERSIEHRKAAYTRIEEQPGRDGFALFFFNDVERFNFYEESQPDRRALPFAVRWEGFLEIPVDGVYPFELAATGAAVLAIDGQPLLTVAADGAEQADRAELALAQGSHRITVEYIRARPAAPSLSLSWDPGGGPRPLAAPELTVEPAGAAWLRRDALLGWAARAVDALFAGGGLILVFGSIKARAATLGRGREGAGDRRGELERPLLALVLAVVLIHALATTGDLYRRAIMLEGGQDWLTYESYARDILLNGPLMTLGKPLGQGRPFFFQPFYPYYLAGLHWLTGEDLWGPTVLQLLGLGVCGVLLYWLAKRLFGARAAWAGLGLFVVLRASQLDWVARELLSENLYFLVLPAAVLLLVRFADESRRRDLVLAGLFLGVASITRAPTLLYVPPAALIVALLLRRQGASWRSAGGAALAIVGLTAAVAALVPLRNYVVSGRPAPVATNGGATLLLAHTPTENVHLARVDRDPVYNALSLDRPTREVLEFARQDPVGYAATLIPLALYSVGFAGAVEGSIAVAPEIVALTVLYAAALVILPASRSLRASLLHVFIAIHLVVMMTFVPYVYGYRQVLPMQLLMLVFAGGLLAHMASRFAHLGGASIQAEPSLAQQRPS